MNAQLKPRTNRNDSGTSEPLSVAVIFCAAVKENKRVSIPRAVVSCAGVKKEGCRAKGLGIATLPKRFVDNDRVSCSCAIPLRICGRRSVNIKARPHRRFFYGGVA